MRLTLGFVFLYLCLLPLSVVGQQADLQVVVTDAERQPLAGVQVELLGEKLGAYTDSLGTANFTGLQPSAYTVRAKRFDLTAFEQAVTLAPGESAELALSLKYAVETAPIEVATRSDAGVTPSLNLQSVSGVGLSKMRVVSLAEGLQFSPGLQMENNCQNCGYTQLRMNGLAGPYTQFLINGRPIFGEMAGIYALEQFPAQLIDRVEIVRGAGSVVAGANAIAGSVNLITRRPTQNFFNVSSTLGVLDGGVLDPVATVNVGTVNDDATAGVMLFGQLRQRQGYDRNADNMSELPQLGTQNLGLSAFFQPNDQSSIDLNAGLLAEDRRGGDMAFERAAHQTELAERIDGRSVYYDARFSQQLSAWQLSVFGGGMHTRRNNYYGGGFDPDGYGYTREDNLNFGTSIGRTAFDRRLTLLLGVDGRYHDVRDEYPGYDRLLEQEAWLAGGFLQANFALTDWLTIDAGVRADYHNLLDRVVTNPRVGLSGKRGQWAYRVNFAQGYRPPVAANEALHMALVGGELRQVVLGEELDAEYSQSLTGGVSRKLKWEGGEMLLKLDGFYTALSNTFVYEPLSNVPGGLTFEMRNGDDSRVMGATLELELQQAWLNLRSGWTYQQTRLDEPAEWSDMLEGDAAASDEYLRTPDWYGYLILTAQPTQALALTAEANFTGSMFAPHYGVPLEDAQAYLAEVPASAYALSEITAGTIRTDALKTTPVFAQLGLHAAYTFKLKSGLDLILKAGGRNLLDSYQNDFDAGPLRDAGFIYGPNTPRMFYTGFSLEY